MQKKNKPEATDLRPVKPETEPTPESQDELTEAELDLTAGGTGKRIHISEIRVVKVVDKATTNL